MTTKSLDPLKIEETAIALHKRIKERFPESGLGYVCNDLVEITKNFAQKSFWFKRPIYPVRIGIGCIVLFIGLILVRIFQLIYVPDHIFNLSSFVQAMESGTNDIVFVGIAIFFLTSLEMRIKRRRALSAIHELRALAHIIDLHQLTKDPDQAMLETQKTSSSPERKMSAFELGRYLDYCSEMLSIVGKVAALYAQTLDDSVVLAAVNEVESLTTNLSSKIWQKIMIVSQAELRGRA